VSNTNLTIDMITNEVMRVAHEKARFLGTIDKQFDVQDSTEVKVDLTMATQKHVAMRFNSAELYTDIDDFSRRKIVPAVSALISDVEADVLQGCTQLVAQVAGTAGTAITDLTAPTLARAKLNQQLAPSNSRAIQMDSVTMAALVKGTSGLFNPANGISEQFREGMVARMAMADFYENERVWTLPNASDVACTLNTYTITNGDSDLTVTSFATPVAGMVFTIADLYDVHPETKDAYPHLKQFTLLSGSTSTTLNISPTIYYTGARKNVGTSTGADITPSDYTTKALTFIGSASTSYVQSLMYQREAFAFVTGELPLMAGADRCVRKTEEGLSLRVWQDSDIRNDEQITRIDILYGYAAIRPQWACRMIGSAN
jgi:hypothetical protein